MSEFAHIALVLLIGLGALLMIFGDRMARGRRSARFAARRHEVLMPHEVANLTQAFGNDPDWQRLLTTVRDQHDGVIRRGHVDWFLSLRWEDFGGPVPNYIPPPGTPYRPGIDRGRLAVDSWVNALLNDKPREALVPALREEADAGSPAAMLCLGMSMIAGEIPGEPADPTAGRAWVDRSLAQRDDGEGHWMLGTALLDGKHLPQDIPAGLALVKESFLRGHDISCTMLADIYYEGLYGEASDPAVASHYAIADAPRWRRTLAALGWAQHGWCRRRARIWRMIRARVSDATVQPASATQEPP